MKFSTSDKDNDMESTYSCAARYYAGFWYKACSAARLTGLYGEHVQDSYINDHRFIQGILWRLDLGLVHPAYADMKIRPYHCHE